MQWQQVVVVRTSGVTARSLGESMARMRAWLDQRGINLTDFRMVPLGIGQIAFEAHFSDAEHAELFGEAFSKEPATAPQPHSTSRS